MLKHRPAAQNGRSDLNLRSYFPNEEAVTETYFNRSWPMYDIEEIK
jgi:hypothetical protein